MSRSGYYDDLDNVWSWIRYRGSVASAIRGKRGQQMLRDLLQALDEMPEKRLVIGSLVTEDGGVCALGSLGLKRHIDMTDVDPEDPPSVADLFDIAEPLAREIAYENDQGSDVYGSENPEQRWLRMRAWVAAKIEA